MRKVMLSMNPSFANYLKQKSVLVFLITLVVISSFTLLAFFTHGRSLAGNDDANITFVYSRNFAHGYGMVYNAGGEHVEGFSSMLWMLLVSVLFRLTNTPQLLILLFNVLALTVSISFLITTFIQLHARTKKPAVSLLMWCGVLLMWIVAIPNYIAWGTITLMEFGLFSALLISALTIILRVSNGLFSSREDRVFLGIVCALVLIRPESMLWGPVIVVLYFIAQWYARGSWRKAVRRTVYPAGIFGLTLLGLILFRLWYFGYPFPNTYYAKVSSDLIYNVKQGLLYIRDFAATNIFVQLFLALAVGMFATTVIKAVYDYWRGEKLHVKELQLGIIAAMLLTGCVVPLVNGGDNFAQYRLFQPIWPIFALLAIQLFALIDIPGLAAHTAKVYVAVAIVVVAFVIFYNANNLQWHKYKEQYYSTNAPQFQLTIEDKHNGEAFNDFFASLPQLPSIGVVAAGGIKMTYQGEVNDLLGLNNVAMAHANAIKAGIKSHAAFNKDVFYAQKPQILNLYLLNSFATDDPKLQELIIYWHDILKGLYDDVIFKSLYTPAVLYNIQKNLYLFGFYSNDFLRSLDANVYGIREISI